MQIMQQKKKPKQEKQKIVVCYHIRRALIEVIVYARIAIIAM